jgi:hypothetical protein
MTWGATVGQTSQQCFSWEKIVDYVGGNLCGNSFSPAGTLCTKANVFHENFMSRSAGMLFYKRMVCTGTSCKVWKTGVCMNVGTNVWSSIYNTPGHNTATHAKVTYYY